jgi:hypothetical protein
MTEHVKTGKTALPANMLEFTELRRTPEIKTGQSQEGP